MPYEVDKLIDLNVLNCNKVLKENAVTWNGSPHVNDRHFAGSYDSFLTESSRDHFDLHDLQTHTERSYTVTVLGSFVNRAEASLRSVCIVLRRRNSFYLRLCIFV